MGEAAVRSFAAQGAKVVIADIQEDRANALAEELGTSAIACHVDATNADAVDAAVRSANEFMACEAWNWVTGVALPLDGGRFRR